MGDMGVLAVVQWVKKRDGIICQQVLRVNNTKVTPQAVLVEFD